MDWTGRTARAPMHQPRAFQHFHMLGNSRYRHGKGFRQLAQRGPPAGQTFQDGATGRVGKSVQGAAQGIHIYHLVYLLIGIYVTRPALVNVYIRQAVMQQ